MKNSHALALRLREVRLCMHGEHGGPLLAEAYDANNKELKNFELKSVKQGQLHEISIYNPQTKSTTRLEFDIKPKDGKKAQP